MGHPLPILDQIRAKCRCSGPYVVARLFPDVQGWGQAGEAQRWQERDDMVSCPVNRLGPLHGRSYLEKNLLTSQLMLTAKEESTAPKETYMIAMKN